MYLSNTLLLLGDLKFSILSILKIDFNGDISVARLTNGMIYFSL